MSGGVHSVIGEHSYEYPYYSYVRDCIQPFDTVNYNNLHGSGHEQPILDSSDKISVEQLYMDAKKINNK